RPPPPASAAAKRSNLVVVRRRYTAPPAGSAPPRLTARTLRGARRAAAFPGGRAPGRGSVRRPRRRLRGLGSLLLSFFGARPRKFVQPTDDAVSCLVRRAAHLGDHALRRRIFVPRAA